MEYRRIFEIKNIYYLGLTFVNLCNFVTTALYSENKDGYKSNIQIIIYLDISRYSLLTVIIIFYNNYIFISINSLSDKRRLACLTYFI